MISQRTEDFRSGHLISESIKLLGFRTVMGPNLYHYKPVIIMKLDLGELTDVPTCDIPQFNEIILEALPGLKKHTCSLPNAGGLCERLKRGTYLAHVTEHIALELSELTGIGVAFGKSRYAGQYGIYEVATRFRNEEGMKACLKTAFDFVQSVIALSPMDLSASISAIKTIIEESALGPSTQSIVNAAESRNIPWRRIGEGSLIQLGYGKNLKRVQAAVTDQTSLIGADIAQDKYLTKQLLQEASLPVSRGAVIRRESEVASAIKNLRLPLVVKPLDGHHGLGVFLNLSNLEEVMDAVRSAQKYCSSILIEEMNHGRDYRMLVINGELVAAAERRPPYVIGDGSSSIETLIEILNADPRRGEGHGKDLSKIEIDDVVHLSLKKRNFDLNSIIPKGEIVYLRDNANLSSGGTATDVTDHVHPQIRNMCERAARVVGLDVCGIDLIHTDITHPLNHSTAIVEVNAGPGLRMHLHPSHGLPRDVGAKIVESLYPKGATSRIPIVSVTGTNGKTTTVRLIKKILSSVEGKTVGLSTSDGIWIGDSQIASGDTTGPLSSRTILSDPSVDQAVLEVARGGLMRGGLAYDWSDVGVITNIRPDHIGQDGIEDVDDLVWVKSLVAERVKEGGTIVLNADDPVASTLSQKENIKKLPREIMYYSVSDTNPLLLNHIESGGRAVFVSQGWIIEANNFQQTRILRVIDVPLTLAGTATFQVSNVIAATAASLAMGTPPAYVIKGLLSFDPISENMGRMNLYKVNQGHVIVDYAHNPDAIFSISEMLKNWRGFKKTVVMGLPGDRADELIVECAEQALKGFDQIILRDDDDLRGRSPGAVPAIVRKTIHQVRPDFDCKVILNTEEAVNFALSQIQPNEVVVILYEDINEVRSLLENKGAKPSVGPFFDKDQSLESRTGQTLSA